MLNNVFLKGLRERRVSMIWWAVGIGLTIVLTVAIYPSMRSNTGLRDYAESSSDMMKATTGSTDFNSPVGYLNGQLYFMMLPIILAYSPSPSAVTPGRGGRPRHPRPVIVDPALAAEGGAREVRHHAGGTAVQVVLLYVFTLLIALAVGMNKIYVMEDGTVLPPSTCCT